MRSRMQEGKLKVCSLTETGHSSQELAIVDEITLMYEIIFAYR